MERCIDLLLSCAEETAESRAHTQYVRGHVIEIKYFVVAVVVVGDIE